MQTECTADALQFQAVGARAVRARFDGGALTSDGGALLLREVERVTGVLRRFADCFTDHRDPARVTHSVAALVRQRSRCVSATGTGVPGPSAKPRRLCASPRNPSTLAGSTSSKVARGQGIAFGFGSVRQVTGNL